MLPQPEDPSDAPASVGDLTVGFLRAAWPWLLAGATAVGLLVFFLWGANRPDDPRLEETPAGEVTPSTPADGLDFAEVERNVGDRCLCVLVADTPEERASGLRHRESELDRVDGMLFVHDEPQTGTTGYFTMAGVVEPLDVAFYDAEGERIGGHSMTPCEGAVTDCEQYPAPDGWQFAIETAPGELPDGPLGDLCGESAG